MRRTPARPGLSFVEANGGRLSTYTFDTEVMDARERLKREFPSLEFLWDHDEHEHLIVGTDTEGTQYLVFACKTFHEEEIRARCHRADNTKSDPLDEIDKHNAAMEKEQDRRFENQMGDVGEKLAWAFGKDGITHRVKNVRIGNEIANAG